ncbi:hypothetical protein SNE40_015335 [Patella caerulea]|uniref:EF-hand domain-containing protein n=1 Tax=Patella caerulea TaxID=87958 RepID=A0AAN8PJ10_PATCE
MATIRFTEFVEKKVRCWFRMMDINKNGSLGLDDFVLVADRFGQEYNLTTGERKNIQNWLQNGVMMILERGMSTKTDLPLFEEIQKDIEKGKKVSEDRFVKAYAEFVTLNPASAKESMTEMVGVFFDIFDNDKNGFVSISEMAVGLKCFGMDPEFAKSIGAMFKETENPDGKISRQSYIDLWVDFLVSENKDNPLLKAYNLN